MPTVANIKIKRDASFAPTAYVIKSAKDYYVNMNEDDFERGTGPMKLHLQWAEGGEQFGVGTTFAFTR